MKATFFKQWKGSLYTLFVAGLLVLRLFFWFSPGHEEKINMTYLWPAVIAALVLVITSRRGGMPWSMRITLCLTAWFFISCVINGDYYLEYNGRFMLGIFMSLGLCYPVLLNAEGEGRSARLSGLAMCYVALMAGLALASLYTAVFNAPLSTPLSDQTLGVREGRLYVFNMHPNEVACSLSIGLFLAVMMALKTGKPLPGALYLLAGLVIYAAVAITVTRTVMITVSLGLGACVYLLVMKLVPFCRDTAKAATGVLLAVVTAAVSFAGFNPTVDLITGLSGQGARGWMTAASAQAAVPAEEPAPPAETQIEDRSLIKDLSTFTGRTEIWRAGMDYIKQRPITLLIGSPDSEVARIPVRSIGRTVYHMHNVLIEMLLLTGIPGLTLYLCLILMVLKGAFQLFFAADTPIYLKFLAVIPPLLMVNGFTEIYPTLSGNVMDMMFFVVSGAVVGFAAERKGAGKLSGRAG